MSRDRTDREKLEGEAATAAAKRAFVSGAADSLSEGIAHLERAAGLGSGEAVAKLAHFLAAGVNQKPDWDRSVDLLLEAAELGWAPAERELRLLAGGQGDTPGALRKQVNIRAWIEPRPTQNASTAPRIRMLPSFMSAEECAWMIETGRDRLKPATVYDPKRVGDKLVDGRSNSAAPFTLLDNDVVLVLLHARMANTIGLPSQLLEPTSLLHYAPGQQFAPHYDFLDMNEPGLAADMARRGQRIATLLIYLNDDYEGGETDFPLVGYRFKGRTGDGLVFANVDPANAPDQRTLHAGLPPTRGEKWLLSQWVRDRPSI